MSSTMPLPDEAPLLAAKPWCNDAAEVVHALASDPERGLSEAEVAQRLARDGPNELRARLRRRSGDAS